jgi:ERCC4-type nuclease
LYPVEQTNDNVQKDKNNNHKKPPKTVSLKDKRPRNQMGLDQFFDKETGTKSQREREIDSINAANEVVKQMNEEIKSIVKLDYREASSTLSAYVSSLGMTVEYDNLTTGDILIDQDILIERKTSRDLLTSIIDGRLFKQCQRMKNGKIKPLLLIELGEIGNSVHPNAVLGALAHITLDLGVPIITTKNSMESAHLIYLIAKQSGGISDSIREFIAYAEIDETEIDKICQIAADEISAMVNEGKDTNLLLTRWKNDGIIKQINLLSSMTKIDTETCTKLIEKYQSIAGLFRTSLVDISNELPEEELQKLAHFY